MTPLVQLPFDLAHNARVSVPQDEGVVAVPKIDVSVTVDIVEFAALRPDCIKRVWLDVTNKI